MGYYVIKTLGCKANLYDSQLIEAELQKRGWHPLGLGAGSPSLCVVNSCTVTDEADRQTRKLASRLSRENPGARVVVTGCAAEVDPERLSRSAGIDYVVGNQDKPRMIDLILSRLSRLEAGSPGDPGSGGEILGSVLEYEELRSKHPMDREWPSPEDAFSVPEAWLEGHSGKTRAFLKIQEGCNSFCTYCIIPYGRGPSRSLQADRVVTQAQALVDRGVREIVITGTNIGDYGVDWGLDPTHALAQLFERLLTETGLERLRVGSLDPAEITEPLFALMERNPRFCPHFHVSLQAASPRILRLMKRKYSIEQVRSCLERISAMPAPLGGPFVGMDVITGFPGETDEEFEAGYRELARLPWSRLHVFPYSERRGTPATRLPGAVAPEVRALRAKRLAALSLERLQAHGQSVLRAQRPLDGVLFERPSAKAPAGVQAHPGMLWVSGYTANYLRVVAALPEAQARGIRNQLVTVDPQQVLTDSAQGDVALLARLRSSE